MNFARFAAVIFMNKEPSKTKVVAGSLAAGLTVLVFGIATLPLFVAAAIGHLIAPKE